jgi:hypothetical protein
MVKSCLDFLSIPLYHTCRAFNIGKRQKKPASLGPVGGSETMRLLRGFYKGTSTTGADVNPLSFALVKHQFLLNIRLPLTIGGLFRVAHIMTELRSFTTYLTLCHLSTSLD